MSHEEVILIPPSEEQASASFHVEAALADRFLTFLKEKKVPLWQPPEDVGCPEPDGVRIVELEITPDVDLQRLEALRREFLSREPCSQSGSPHS